MNSKTKDKLRKSVQKMGISQEKSLDKEKKLNQEIPSNIENICNENLITLEKIHAILINCKNLTKDQKFEFAENERYYMKLYLKKLNDRLKK